MCSVAAYYGPFLTDGCSALRALVAERRQRHQWSVASGVSGLSPGAALITVIWGFLQRFKKAALFQEEVEANYTICSGASGLLFLFCTVLGFPI